VRAHEVLPRQDRVLLVPDDGLREVQPVPLEHGRVVAAVGVAAPDVEPAAGDQHPRDIAEPRLQEPVERLVGDEVVRQRIIKGVSKIFGEIAIIAERAGFADRLMVSADGSIAAGDCRIDWGSGGAERDGERLWQEIESILAATAPRIEALAPDGRLRLTAQPAATRMSDSNSTGDSDA